MDSNLYKKTQVKVQRKSGFDKSYQNLFTTKVGTITPILCDEVIGNTTINLRAAIQAKLPPLASDTFMRCNLKYAAFFVPTRILIPGYERWLTGTDSALAMPTCRITTTDTLDHKLKVLGPGSLADFLGVKMTRQAISNLSTSVQSLTFSALPFLAYHRIYEEWFRNSRVQRSIYATTEEKNNLGSNALYYNAYLSNENAPNTSPGRGHSFASDILVSNALYSPIFADGVSLFDLRQANFDIDLFTSAAPSAQDGNAARVTIGAAGIDAPAVNGTFSISQLRAANSLQLFMERNNLAGNRLVDYVRAHFGSSLNDAIAQRPVLLGSGSFAMYSKGIYQTALGDGSSTSNPFAGSTGAEFGSAVASGSCPMVNNFTASEPGYIMAVCWLSPRVTYSTGMSPYLLRYLTGTSGDVTDMADPLLQNVGNQPILQSWLDDAHMTDDSSISGSIFGYNDRYCDWKDKVDEVHGLLRDTESLQSFALQRTFTAGSNPTISSDFLSIPTDYLDQVAAVEDSISDYGLWVDSFLDYKVSMPLARYSTPSLEDPAREHGEDVTISNRGVQLT